jgi:energy-coupling factor transporter ATP-binding protein EcfA2
LAVDHLSFSVQSGQVTGFLGLNGAGKSTTMRMILGWARHRVARSPWMAWPTTSWRTHAGPRRTPRPSSASSPGYAALAIVIGAILFKKRDA